MKLRTVLLASVAALVTGALIAQAQVPGVNSTLNSVFTLAYDNSTMKPTYSSTSALFTVASAATDVCTLAGSATKTVKVRRVILSGAATAVTTEPVEVIKRSTAATTGVSVVEQLVSYDSINIASGAKAEHYTTSPTVGASLGPVAMSLIYYPNFTTGINPVGTIFTFGQLGQPVVLRGIAQNVAVNLLGFAPSGLVMNCTFEWTEE